MAVEADCRALIDAAVGAFGRLDTLVNNAGMSAQALLQVDRIARAALSQHARPR